jgi:hypothetical protein
MTSDKFAFSENSLSLVATARGLVKSRYEKQRIARCGGTDSSEERRDRLGAGVRAANVEIQPGGYFDRSDRLDIDRVVGFFVRRRGLP